MWSFPKKTEQSAEMITGESPSVLSVIILYQHPVVTVAVTIRSSACKIDIYIINNISLSLV